MRRRYVFSVPRGACNARPPSSTLCPGEGVPGAKVAGVLDGGRARVHVRGVRWRRRRWDELGFRDVGAGVGRSVGRSVGRARARRHRGCDQGRGPARRLRMHRGLRRRRAHRSGQDLRGVLRRRQRERRRQRTHDRAAVQDVLPDPGERAELAEHLHRRDRRRRCLRDHGHLRRLHRRRAAVCHAGSRARVDHPRRVASLDRRRATRPAALSRHHGRAPDRRDRLAARK